MSTIAEIEDAVAGLPRQEQEALLRRLTDKLRQPRVAVWPVPPPNVPKEEIRRIQAEIDRVFSKVDC